MSQEGDLLCTIHLTGQEVMLVADGVEALLNKGVPIEQFPVVRRVLAALSASATTGVEVKD